MCASLCFLQAWRVIPTGVRREAKRGSGESEESIHHVMGPKNHGEERGRYIWAVDGWRSRGGGGGLTQHRLHATCFFLETLYTQSPGRGLQEQEEGLRSPKMKPTTDRVPAHDRVAPICRCFDERACFLFPAISQPLPCAPASNDEVQPRQG